MALIVQKYGGSSLADADRIKGVARRIGETRDKGNQVVAVVSAMGDTTDELSALAPQSAERPDHTARHAVLSTPVSRPPHPRRHPNAGVRLWISGAPPARIRQEGGARDYVLTRTTVATGRLAGSLHRSAG